MNAHTDGPWEVNGKMIVPVNRPPNTLALAQCFWGGNEGNANAKLMASAPELFDALEMLQIATLGYVKRPPVVQTALEVAEAALCKVRGTKITGVKMDFGRSKHEALIDMLTGLMHANVGFDNALEMARVHFEEEKKEGVK